MKEKMTTVTLDSIESALGYLRDLDIDADNIKFLGEMGTLEIEIEGPLFHGGMTGELARGLAELQDELYRAARLAITGKEGRDSRLTKDQRELLELKIEVRKGCTLVNIDIGKFGESLIKILGNQLNNMSPGDVQFLVIGSLAVIAFGWIGTAAVKEHFKAKAAAAEKHEETERLKAAIAGPVQVAERLAAVIQREPRIQKFADGAASGLTQVAVRATDATSVKIGRIELDEDDLIAMRRRAPRSTSETIHETGDFRVLHVDGAANPFKLLLGGAVIPGEFAVEYDSTEFPQEQDAMIWTALRERGVVRLEVKAELIRNKVKGAVIVNINPPH